MQKAKINGVDIDLPMCHEGDKEWLASVLYGITTKRHEGTSSVNKVQRESMMRTYEATYTARLEANAGKIDAESLARRAANIELRHNIDAYIRLSKGIFAKNY